MTNKSALFFACDGEDVVDFAEELGRKGFHIIVVNSMRAKLMFSRRKINHTFSMVSSTINILESFFNSILECCVVFVNTRGPLTLDIAAQSNTLRLIVVVRK